MPYKPSESLWGPPVDVLFLSSNADFTSVHNVIHEAIQETARRHPYNTLDTFVKLHQAFRDQNELTLDEFTKINPVIHNDDNLNCIGLSNKVMKYATERDPGLAHYMFLGLCNDYDCETPDPRDPPTSEQALSFDHMLMVLQFNLKGRRGYFLADIALLIDTPIVVMADKRPPHTGPFRSRTREEYRENDVQIVNDIHAVWKYSEYRHNATRREGKRVIYLEKPFLDPDSVDRRAKFIPFHAYMLMGNGGFKAGLYHVLGADKRRFTVGVPDETGRTVTARFPYEYFCEDHEKEDEDDVVLEMFSKLCGFGTKADLIKRYRQLSETYKDTEFIDEVLRLYKKYHAISKSAVLDSFS